MKMKNDTNFENMYPGRIFSTYITTPTYKNPEDEKEHKSTISAIKVNAYVTITFPLNI